MRIIYGLLCLCFLIFFHELGHFIFAKLFGVVVEAFSIGFGPVLLHKKINDTDYRLSLIPLGGYCAMKGEKDFIKALENDLPFIDGEKDSLYGIHRFKRIIIAFAGPFFNLLFSYIGFTIIAIAGYSYYSYSNQIKLATDSYPEIQSPAKDAGIMTGDVIIKINNSEIKNFSDIVEQVSLRPDENIKISYIRNDIINEVVVHTLLDKSTGIGKIGIMAIPDTISKYDSKKYTFFPALIQGIKECIKGIKTTIKGFSTLFKGIDLSHTVSGPARIADMMGNVIQDSFSENFKAGIVNMLSFMGIISISLFIMNLLPFPILDGGLILIAFIELITNRKLSPKILYYFQLAGIFIIASLFLIGLNGDIKYFSSIFKGKF